MGSLAQEAISTETLTLHPFYLQQIPFSACEQWGAGLFYKNQPSRKICHRWLQLLCGSSRVIPWITYTLRSQGHAATKIHSFSFVPQTCTSPSGLMPDRAWVSFKESEKVHTTGSPATGRRSIPGETWSMLPAAAQVQGGLAPALLFLWSKLQPFWPLRPKS